MIVGKLIVWLIIGALAGTLAGRVVTFSREGFGFWTNLLVGMAGAVVGGLLFGWFGVDFGLDALKVSFEDLVSAFAGSLVCILAWWAIRAYAGTRRPRTV